MYLICYGRLSLGEKLRDYRDRNPDEVSAGKLLDSADEDSTRNFVGKRLGFVVMILSLFGGFFPIREVIVFWD